MKLLRELEFLALTPPSFAGVIDHGAGVRGGSWSSDSLPVQIVASVGRPPAAVSTEVAGLAALVPTCRRMEEDGQWVGYGKHRCGLTITFRMRPRPQSVESTEAVSGTDQRKSFSTFESDSFAHGKIVTYSKTVG